MTNDGRPQGLKPRGRCPQCRKVFATFVPSGGGEPRCAPHGRVDAPIGEVSYRSWFCPGGGKFADPAEPLEVA